LRHAVRLGFRSIDGFREEWAATLTGERARAGPYRSIDDLRARARLPAAALDALASADAAQSLNLTRRRALWAAKGLPPAKPAPLFEFAGLHEGDGAPPDALPVAPLSDEVIQDYQTLRLSLKAHPLSFLRDTYAALGAITAAETLKVRDGAPCAMAGVVLVRQMPGSAKGVVFMTLEDETGVVNTVVWPTVFEAHRPIAMGARLVLARGRIQRSDNVTHLVVDTLVDRSGDLATLSEAKFDPPFARSDEVTHPMPPKGGGGGLHPKPPSPDSNRGSMRGSHPAMSAFCPGRESSIRPRERARQHLGGRDLSVPIGDQDRFVPSEPRRDRARLLARQSAVNQARRRPHRECRHVAHANPLAGNAGHLDPYIVRGLPFLADVDHAGKTRLPRMQVRHQEERVLLRLGDMEDRIIEKHAPNMDLCLWRSNRSSLQSRDDRLRRSRVAHLRPADHEYKHVPALRRPALRHPAIRSSSAAPYPVSTSSRVCCTRAYANPGACASING
jgi:hypothetical protein